MLDRIRKTADTVVIKILLFLIALSFVGLGGASFINRNRMSDVVSFDVVENISYEEFARARAQELRSIQSRYDAHNITDDLLDDIGLDSNVIRKLIIGRMTKHLSKLYDLDITDDKVIEHIKSLPYFQNEKGEFELERFKRVFQDRFLQQDEYLSEVKDGIISSLLFSAIGKSMPVPSLLEENMRDYLAENRLADVFVFDLNKFGDSFSNIDQKVTDDEVKDFYNKNLSKFFLNEARSFSYVKFTKKDIEKLVSITKQEIIDFFESNSSMFGKKPLGSVEPQIIDALIQEKLPERTQELVKNIEDEIANGSTIAEIAKKYDLKLHDIKGKTLSDMRSGADADADMPHMADAVFEISEGEICYPIENASKNEVFIAQLNKIVAEKQQTLQEVELVIKALLVKQRAQESRISNINKLRENYISSSGLLAATRPDQKLLNLAITRMNAVSENKIPLGLIEQIFTADLNNVTKLFREGDKLYFAHVKQVSLDKKAIAALKKNGFSDVFREKIRNMTIQEIIWYLAKVKKMEIKQPKKILE